MEPDLLSFLTVINELQQRSPFQGCPYWQSMRVAHGLGFFHHLRNLHFQLTRSTKTVSLSPLLGKVEPVKGGCMYLEALKAILFVRILPPKRQTITKGILVNKRCLTSLCKNIFNGCKHLKPLYHQKINPFVM